MDKKAKAVPPAKAGTEENSPKQAQIVASILKSMGVEEYEPRVVIQLLEFMQRYTAEVLEDATVYSEHAGKTRMDVDDVRLATQSKVNFSFTAPPPREFMMELASKRNAAPLPAIPPKLGVRLPLERYCLSAVNYSINGTPETPAAITSAAPPPAVVPKNAPAAAKKPKVELKTAAPLKRAAEEDDDWD